MAFPLPCSRLDELGPTQPPMMTFKAFMEQCDDSISEEEALRKYSDYKLEFKRQQLNEFFINHKEEEWWAPYNITFLLKRGIPCWRVEDRIVGRFEEGSEQVMGLSGCGLGRWHRVITGINTSRKNHFGTARLEIIFIFCY